MYNYPRMDSEIWIDLQWQPPSDDTPYGIGAGVYTMVRDNVPYALVPGLCHLHHGRVISSLGKSDNFRTALFEPLLIRYLEVQAARLDYFSELLLVLSLGLCQEGIVSGGTLGPVPLDRPLGPMSGGRPRLSL